jgi:hypothetical protein
MLPYFQCLQTKSGGILASLLKCRALKAYRGVAVPIPAGSSWKLVVSFMSWPQC